MAPQNKAPLAVLPDDAPPLRIALGSSSLVRSQSTNGHLDGIGTYTNELGKYLRDASVAITPFAFKRRFHSEIPLPAQAMPGVFDLNLLRSAVTGASFPMPRGMEAQYDLFHATDHYIPKLRNIPVLATIMDPIPLMHPEWTGGKHRALKNWLFRREAQWADHYLTISNFVVGDIVEHFRIPAERVTVIELGVDDDFFVPIDVAEKTTILQEMGLQAPFFLFVGTLQPRKNLLRLVTAFRSLPEDIQRRCPLVVAGREGWSSEADREALHALEVEGKGRWLNYVSMKQKKALLQTARALVFPSLYEGFGLPVLEAFASGLAVIASNTTSLPEVAGDAALLINPIDVEDLSHAMQRIVEDDELCAALQKAGRERALLFTWRRTAERTAAHYRHILA